MEEIANERLATRAITKSITRLPAEMMMRIFNIFCLFEEYDLLDLDCPLYRRATRVLPITLSHVCRSWREMASSMPHLWSLIVFIHEPITPQLLNYARRCLDLSKSSPLYISIIPKLSVFSLASAGDIFTLVELLLVHRSRWKVFHIHWDGQLPSAVFNSTFDTLEFASIRRTDKDALLSAICRSPNLQRLSCQPTDILSPQDPQPAFLPPSLTHLCLETISLEFDDIACILHQCPHLVELSCFVIASEVQPDVQTLHNLRKLSVTSTDDSSSLFDMLKLPNLAHVAIYHASEARPSPARALERLLDRSQCWLQSFHIRLAASTLHPDERLPSIFRLKSMQSVTRLSLDLECISTVTVPGLSVCMPNLRDILFCLPASSPNGSLEKSFATMALSRVQRAFPDDTSLRSVHVSAEESDGNYLQSVANCLLRHGTIIGTSNTLPPSWRSSYASSYCPGQVEFLYCTALPGQPGDILDLVNSSQEWWGEVQAELVSDLAVDPPLLAKAFKIRNSPLNAF